MITFADKWQSLLAKANALISTRALFRIIILCAFICGQVGTSAHSHAHNAQNTDEHVHEHHYEHDHEEQEHRTPCQLCTLAATEEDIDDTIDFPEILDGPDFLNLSAVMSAYRINAIQAPPYFQVSSKQYTTATPLLLDAARAPPIN